MDSAVNLHFEQFEGPLELLLSLISKNKVEITDIPVALICDQYMDYLRQMEALDMEIASSFIVMAAHLILIKTRILLPRPEEEEAEDPRAELAEALLEYKRIKTAAVEIAKLTEVGLDRLVREPSPLEALPVEYRNKPSDLIRALRRMTARENKKTAPGKEAFEKIVGREPAPVEERVAAALETLGKKKRLHIRDMCRGAKNRSELVAVFLAVLELLNQRKAVIEDEDGTVQMLDETAEDEEKVRKLGRPDKQPPILPETDIREKTLIPNANQPQSEPAGFVGIGFYEEQRGEQNGNGEL